MFVIHREISEFSNQKIQTILYSIYNAALKTVQARSNWHFQNPLHSCRCRANERFRSSAYHRDLVLQRVSTRLPVLKTLNYVKLTRKIVILRAAPFQLICTYLHSRLSFQHSFKRRLGTTFCFKAACSTTPQTLIYRITQWCVALRLLQCIHSSIR